MSEIDERLREISDKISAHITAVKGTLELLDASVSEDDLRNLILKAVERMDKMQLLSDEMFAALKQLLEKIGKTENGAEK
jgi:hypothetical protein